MNARDRLRAGLVIPAHPLALTAKRTLDEAGQRALTRYYIKAGAGGLAVAVHTTQFAIRDPRHGLLESVLRLAMDTARDATGGGDRMPVMIAGAIGRTAQAIAEASLARALGYDACLLSLGALGDASEGELIEHCRAVSEVLPLFGFYLQPAVGGRVLGYSFWRRFAEIENVWAAKIAPFDRYRTLDAVRGIGESGRDDIALYTGNDDNIVHDLLASFPVTLNGETRERRFDGGLLGQWAMGTRRAVALLAAVKRARESGEGLREVLRIGAAVTDFNGAVFDAANGFAGCIPGIHAVLMAEGLMASGVCLDEREGLSRGQREEIERVMREHGELLDSTLD